MYPDIYYKKFEDRQPYINSSVPLSRIHLFRLISLIYVGIGISYFYWRWFISLNPDALWFSVPLVTAEFMMFFGSLLMIINYWDFKIIPRRKTVQNISGIDKTINQTDNRPLKIDLFITTYNEPIALVEDTIKDAKNLNYPFDDVEIAIYLCDDGKRNGSNAKAENFKDLADRYKIQYITRDNNSGYKAGNLNNAFWQSEGDLLVILDADTRLFPDFLVNLTGYFRDEKMAWVQSPQWFYDIPEGKNIFSSLNGKSDTKENFIFRWLPFSKKINSGEDLLGTDSRLFYNAILAHRNSSNAAFCCGAGSIHRRKALESLVLNSRKRLSELNSNIFIDAEKVKNKKFAITASSNGVITGPFVHHISEDIYTSILLHSEKEKWKSYQHPDVECKMLSPQTLPDYVKQFSRYAEGTFDIFFSRDNPLIKKGLTPRQKLAYAETIYSYFSPLWILIFLLSPIIFYFFLIPPIKAFNFDFFIRFLSLHLFSQLMVTTAHWGMSTKRAEQYYIGGFWIKLKALYKVIIGKKLQFNTTIKERKINPLSYNLKFIYPHLVIIALTLIGLIYNGILIINETHPSYSAFFANTLWASYNIYLINPIVRAAFIK